MTLKLGWWILVVNLYNRNRLKKNTDSGMENQNVRQPQIIKVDNGQDIII